MQKRKIRYLITFSFVIVLAAGIFFIKKAVDYKNNFFAYAVDLENENWTYAPKGLDYGMTIEEVIKADEIVTYTWEKQGEILRTEKVITGVSNESGELIFAKRYFFDSNGELASVRYELITDYTHYEALRQLLYEQALFYMPETNRKTEAEDIIIIGEKSGILVTEKLGYAKESDDEDFRRIKIPVTRVVWEDTVYASEEDDTIVTYANSDAVLGIDVRYDGEVTVSLAVSRYEERLSGAEIQEIRDKYPMHSVEDELEAASDLICYLPMPLYPVDWAVINEETIVWIEVTDDYTATYTKRYGEQYRYPAQILGDTEGLLAEGEKRYFERKFIWEEYGPASYVGSMQMIFPLEEYYINENPEKLAYSARSTFYVTKDGYVIAGFDEDEYSGAFERCVISESSLCGLTVEDLLRKLKK